MDLAKTAKGRVNDVTERGMGGVSSNASFSKIVMGFFV